MNGAGGEDADWLGDVSAGSRVALGYWIDTYGPSYRRYQTPWYRDRCSRVSRGKDVNACTHWADSQLGGEADFPA
jgi:hypothetical protein